MRKRLFCLAVAVGGLVAALAVSAQGAMAGNGTGCGSTIGPGGYHVLTHDILECDQDPALTIVGPVKVNLGGHTISADPGTPPKIGILVEGTRATLKNGTISGFAAGSSGLIGGVVAAGTGSHSFVGLTVRGLGPDTPGDYAAMSIREGSNHNLVTRSLFESTTDEGIDVRGDNNLFISNKARNNQEQGFDDAGNRNTWLRNTALQNGLEGFRVGGNVTGSRLLFNIAFDNGDEGVEANLTSGVLLKGNTFKQNHGQGIVIGSTALNTVVAQNLVIGNGEDGIWLRDATGTLVQGNIALRNGDGTTQFDLTDSAGCVGNTWRLNIFRTSNDPCIK